MLKYAELLKPAKQDSLLAAGGNPLPTALYLAGVSGCRAHALVPAAAPALSETQAVEYARRNMPELAPAVEKGLALTTFSITSLDKKAPPFSKAVLVEENHEKLLKDLNVLAAADAGEKLVLLDLPFSFFRPFTAAARRLFAKPRTLSLRKILEESGAACQFYDAADHRLYALTSLARFSPAFSSATPVDDASFAQLVKAELAPFAGQAAPGSKFAARLLEDEYLAFTTVSEAADAQTDYSFVFLDGASRLEEAGVKEYAKKFTVAVLPNTPAFVKEIEAKEALIVPKEKILSLFGEKT